MVDLSTVMLNYQRVIGNDRTQITQNRCVILEPGILMEKYSNWLVVSNMTFIFHFIYGMSSFPLTHIFQDGYCTINQVITYNMI